MARTPGSVNRSNAEYQQIYDRMVDKYCCPVELAFKIMKSSRKHQTKLKCIEILMPYKFSKLASMQVQVEQAQQITMDWGDPESIQAPDLDDLQIPDIIGTATRLDD